MKRERQNPVRIAYLVSHPIQYQAPLLRKIAKHPEFDLTVFFRTDFSTKNFEDPGFGRQIKWDTDLISGYRFEVLPAIGNPGKLSFWYPLNYGLWQGLKKGNFQVLWIHGYAPPFHIFAMIIAKMLGIKVLVRDEATLISKNRGRLNKLIKKLFFRGLDFFVDGFLAIGTLNKEYYLANGIHQNKVFDMPYAVDNDFFQKAAHQCEKQREALRTSMGLAAERPIILFASKLALRKRGVDLLEAFKIVFETIRPRPYLLYVGDGEMRGDMVNRIKEAHLEKDVLILGFKNQGELPCYYDLCDVFVLPSLHEPWGLVINEAMNAGRAVVASHHVASAHDLIRQGENGFIFKAGNIQELSYALKETLSSKQRCRDMGKASLTIISAWDFNRDIDGLLCAARAILYEEKQKA